MPILGVPIVMTQNETFKLLLEGNCFAPLEGQAKSDREIGKGHPKDEIKMRIFRFLGDHVNSEFSGSEDDLLT